MEKRKIRVLRIINRFNLGGPTYNAAYLTKYLGEDFETKLIGGAKDSTEASSEYILEGLGLKPTIIDSMKRSIGFDDIQAYKAICRIIYDYKPDILHTHASKAGTLGRLAAIQMKVPIVVHTFHGHVFHSYFGELKTRFYKGIERYLAERSTAIIAISNQQKIELTEEHKICDPERTNIIPLGFDLTRFAENRSEKRKSFRSQYGLSDDEIAIVIVGRLVPIKNHDLFIQACTMAFQQEKKLRFFIVGDGESKESIIESAERDGLAYTLNQPVSHQRPLCFTSWIKDVDWVYAGCDIVCLTSLNEGTPVSLIEAQSAAKPIVSTKVGGIHDIVSEGKSALLSDRHDVQQLTQNILTLAIDSDKRLTMGLAGEEHAGQQFSYKRLCSDVAFLYHRLLKEKDINVE